MSIAAARTPSSKSVRLPCLPRPKLTCNHGGLHRHRPGRSRSSAWALSPRSPERARGWESELRVREGDAPGPTYVAAVQQDRPTPAAPAGHRVPGGSHLLGLPEGTASPWPAHCSLVQTLSATETSACNLPKVTLPGNSKVRPPPNSQILIHHPLMARGLSHGFQRVKSHLDPDVSGSGLLGIRKDLGLCSQHVSGRGGGVRGAGRAGA